MDKRRLTGDRAPLEDLTNTTHGGSGDAPSVTDRLVTCPKERKRERDRARKAAMSIEQRAVINKRRCELYAAKKAANMLQMNPNETVQSIEGQVPLTIGVPCDLDDNLTDMDINNIHETDGVTQKSPIPLPNNCIGEQTQSSVVDGTSPVPPNSAKAHAPDSMVEDDGDEDDEAYVFTGQKAEEEETDDERSVEKGGQDNSDDDVSDPYERVLANVPSEEHVLSSVPNCQHCNMKKFEDEPPGFCCRCGKIHLSTPDTPPELMRLWTSSDPDARHFRANIRYFNGHFSFTSLYYHLDHVTTNMRNSGVYTFCAHGQIYHNIKF